MCERDTRRHREETGDARWKRDDKIGGKTQINVNG